MRTLNILGHNLDQIGALSAQFDIRTEKISVERSKARSQGQTLILNREFVDQNVGESLSRTGIQEEQPCLTSIDGSLCGHHE